MRRTTIIALLLIMTLVSVLTRDSLVASASGGDQEPYTIKTDGPILPPPGASDSSSTITAMLELVPGADPNQVEQAAISLGAIPIYRTKLVYSGIAVSTSMQTVRRLEAITGVAHVHLLPAKQRLRTRISKATSITPMWHKPINGTGKGVRIGIIDSGVDYTHLTFGGPGTQAAYNNNNSSIIEPGSFPTTKVAGGTDLAGDNYDSDGQLGSNIPAPDPDPLDCRIPETAGTLNRGGHGTHIAALAAGYGINNGQTFPGPYTNDLNTSTFELAPGVAPEATIYAYKVFGCRGSTSLLSKAIELALDPNSDGNYSDRKVDILEIAVGSPFGGPDDPDAQAINKAVELGVTVVVAAGDNGNTFYVGSSPGNATGAITVGAADTTDLLASFSARGPQRGNETSKPDLVAYGVGLKSAASGTGNGSVLMDGTSTAAAQVAGAAAIVLQINSSWKPGQVKAALMNTATPLAAANGALYPTSLAGAGLLNIPALINLKTLAYVDGEVAPVSLTFGAPRLNQPYSTVKQLTLFNNETISRIVVISNTLAVSETGVTVSTPDKFFIIPPKNSITVPVSVTVDPSQLDSTQDAFTPEKQGGIAFRHALAEHSGFIHIASVNIARIRGLNASAYPKITIYVDGKRFETAIEDNQFTSYRQIAPGKHLVSILPDESRYGRVPAIIERQVDLSAGLDYTFIVAGQNTANMDLTLLPVAREVPTDVIFHLYNANVNGAVDAYIDNQLVASNMAFGQYIGPIHVSRKPHVVKFLKAGTNKLVAKDEVNTKQGETYLFGVGQWNHDCGDDHHTSDDTAIQSTPTSGGDHNDCAPEHVGFGQMSQNLPLSTISLNVPFQIFPKAASASQTTLSNINVTAGQTSIALPLTNSGARNTLGLPLGAQTPLSAAFALVGTSPQLSGLGSTASADIHYVGLTSNYFAIPTHNIALTRLFFATTSYAAWSTPSEVQYMVYIDSTGPAGVADGIDDYVLVGTSYGAISSTQPQDTFVSALYAIQADGTFVAPPNIPLLYMDLLPPPTTTPSVDVTPYNSTVMFQAVSARFLGLSNTNTTFNYHIETRSRDADNYNQVVDRFPATGSLSYNITSAALAPMNTVSGTPNLAQTPVFLGTTGSQITANVNPAAIAASSTPTQLLLLHLNNTVEHQTELVDVTATP